MWAAFLWGRICHHGAVPPDPVHPLTDLAPADQQALLLEEGDRLAADLAFRLGVTPGQQERVQFIGRTLASNLTRLFISAVEDVTRKVGKPLRVVLTADALQRPELVIADGEGRERERVTVDGLLGQALYQGSRLHPAVETHLRAAAEAGNEHLATCSLVACLKSKPVLDVSLPYLKRYTR